MKVPSLWTSSSSNRPGFLDLSNLTRMPHIWRSMLEIFYGIKISSSPSEALRESLGRISILRELGGKVRLFAIGSYLQQLALKPVHDLAFSILKALPSDFTHNQNLFSQRLVSGFYGDPSSLRAWCYDLKSATDLTPTFFQRLVLDEVLSSFGTKIEGFEHLRSSVGTSWAKCIRSCTFIYGEGTDLEMRVKYSLGQPMGLFSSWPVFALSHHFMVWIASTSIDLDTDVTLMSYAIVGDDIIILREDLAEAYLKVVESLGLTISLKKTLLPTETQSLSIMEFLSVLYRNSTIVSRLPLGLADADQLGLQALAAAQLNRVLS